MIFECCLRIGTRETYQRYRAFCLIYHVILRNHNPLFGTVLLSLDRGDVHNVPECDKILFLLMKYVIFPIIEALCDMLSSI